MIAHVGLCLLESTCPFSSFTAASNVCARHCAERGSLEQGFPEWVWWDGIVHISIKGYGGGGESSEDKLENVVII